MPKFNVKLTKIESNHKKVRTNEVVGWSHEFPPEVGSSFVMTAPPLDPDAGIRLVTTSTIMEVLEASPEALTFKTRNSTYKVEIIKP